MHICGTLTIVLSLLLAACASASLQTIPAGGTVFVGEEGLDIRSTGVTDGATIGWWGAGVRMDSPAVYTYSVTDAGSFYASPVTFTERTGNWYLLPGKHLVFTVQDPVLALRIFDESLDFEATGRWVPAGDMLSFRIESNLYEMMKRPGVNGAPVTIHVQGPSGAEYTSVVGPGGDRTSLTDIPVSTSVFSTGPVWYTGDSSYSRGNYSVWAECNANGMKDNYEVEGKTVTAVPAGGNLQILGENPDITKKRAAAANTTTSATPAGPTTTALEEKPSPSLTETTHPAISTPSPPGTTTVSSLTATIPSLPETTTQSSPATFSPSSPGTTGSPENATAPTTLPPVSPPPTPAGSPWPAGAVLALGSLCMGAAIARSRHEGDGLSTGRK